MRAHPAWIHVSPSYPPPPAAAASPPLIGIHFRNHHGSNNGNTFVTKLDWLLSPLQRLAVRDSYNHQDTITLNHQPFSNPAVTVTNVQFGQITGTTGSPRILHLALKYAF